MEWKEILKPNLANLIFTTIMAVGSGFVAWTEVCMLIAGPLQGAIRTSVDKPCFVLIVFLSSLSAYMVSSVIYYYVRKLISNI